MIQKCLSCGVAKDPSVKERYPYPDDGIIIDEPIEPLLTIDCVCPDDCRVATMCHECFHKLDVDMWVSDHCWRSLNPVNVYEQLPKKQFSE